MSDAIVTKKHILTFDAGSKVFFFPWTRKSVGQYCDRITEAIGDVLPEAELAPDQEIRVHFRKIGPPGRWYDGYSYDIRMSFGDNIHDTILHEETHCAMVRANLPQDHDEEFPKTWYPMIQKRYREKYGWLRLLLDCGGKLYFRSEDLGDQSEET